jgi:hypothetical protein
LAASQLPGASFAFKTLQGGFTNRDIMGESIHGLHQISCHLMQHVFSTTFILTAKGTDMVIFMVASSRKRPMLRNG